MLGRQARAGKPGQSHTPTRGSLLTPYPLHPPLPPRDYLDAYSIPYNDVILEELEGGQALRLELAERYGRTSVPAVFINSEVRIDKKGKNLRQS